MQKKKEESLEEKITSILKLSYACTRDWSAWQVGTMTQDDFKPAEETEILTDLVDLVAQLLAEKDKEAKEKARKAIKEVRELSKYIMDFYRPTAMRMWPNYTKEMCERDEARIEELKKEYGNF